MKRVLLLVLLIVSLVELALERDKVYLLFSTAALAGLVRTSLTSRRQAQNAPKVAFVRKDAVGQMLPHAFPAEQVYTSSPHFRRITMRKLSLIAGLLTLCLAASSAYAQQVDVAFGVSGLSAPAGTTDSSGIFFPTMGGGAYPGFSGDLLLNHRLGVEGELFWRASQNLYGGFQPFRPIFYNFNAIWAPRLTKSITAEVLAGIGGEDLRFYTGNVSCDLFTGSCTNYVSSNHFMGDIGAGLRYYLWHNAFVRPEARLYLIHNNVEFSSGRAARIGISIGYSFGR